MRELIIAELHVYPVVLGGGKRLFPTGKRLNLTLVEASQVPRGVYSCAIGMRHKLR
jgi:dihydrofolate reductase